MAFTAGKYYALQNPGLKLYQCVEDQLDPGALLIPVAGTDTPLPALVEGASTQFTELDVVVGTEPGLKAGDQIVGPDLKPARVLACLGTNVEEVVILAAICIQCGGTNSGLEGPHRLVYFTYINDGDQNPLIKKISAQVPFT